MTRPQGMTKTVQNDSSTRRAGDEPLPGYRLIEPLGKGGFGEVWKCEVPGGFFKAIKFIYGNLDTIDQDGAPAAQELDALQHMKLIRHPFILSTERIEIQGGEVFVVMELADQSLEDLFIECQSAGLAGIPREKLLGHVLEVAEVLDLLSQQHGLQHLDIKPRNVLLVGNHVKVADFGLVKKIVVSEANKHPPRFLEVSPQYASPEAFHGKFSRHSDQYSLAILYQKMLTGQLPFQGRNARQIMMQHLTAKPDLESLSAEDQPIVARALAKDPDQRFPSCRAFIQEIAFGIEQPTKNAGPKASSLSGTPRPLSLSSLRNLLKPKLNNGRAQLSENQVETAPDGTEPKSSDIGAAPHTSRSGGIGFAPLPTFHFLDCLNQSPMGELWKAKQPDGQGRLIYFLPGSARSEDQALQHRIRRLRECRHLIVPNLEMYQNAVGQLALVSECYPRTLRDRFQECSSQGLRGIQRFELLRYLSTVAEALDDLYWRYEITHLGLNPQSLALHNDRIVMTQFGNLELAWLLAGQPTSPPNALYAAPELARSSGSSASDQFSLALIFAELLTGIHPRPALLRSRRSCGLADRINLDFVPANDRDILAQALDNDPDKRFASCSDFVQALKRTTVAVRDVGRLPGHLLPVIPFSSLLGEPLSSSADLPTVHELVTEQQADDMGAAQVIKCGRSHYHFTPTGVLEHKLFMRSLSHIGKLDLGGFRYHWKLQIAEQTKHSILYRLHAQQSFWEQWLGQPQGLEIQLTIPPMESPQPKFTEVTIHIQAFGGDRGTQMLRMVGHELIQSLQTFLKVNPERRQHHRWDCQQPLRVYPIFPDLELAEPMPGITRDLSVEGIRLCVPERPTTSYFYVHLNTSERLSRWVILARIVRIEAKKDGWFEVGAAFPRTAEKSLTPTNGLNTPVSENMMSK